MFPIPVLRKIKTLLKLTMTIVEQQPVIDEDMVDFKRCGNPCSPLAKCRCRNKHGEGVPLWYASSRFETINRNGPSDSGISIDISNSIHPGRDCRDRELDRAQSFCGMFKGDRIKKISVSIAMPCKFLIVRRSCLRVSSACRDARSQACIPCLPVLPPTERLLTLCWDSQLTVRRTLEKSLSTIGAMQRGRRS